MTTLTGTGALLRLILRRDRFLLPAWAVLLAVVPVSYVASINELFPDAAGRQVYADASAHSPGFVALYGRLYGSSLGELVAWRAGFIPVMIGLFALLTVIRHTRTEEETGRRELLGSTVVGRHAGLAAALLSTTGASLVLGLLTALGMMSQQLPAAGSWAFGLEFAASGIVFAAVGAVAAQLSAGAGAARGTAVVVLGAAYVLRVIGDISALGNGALGWVSWLSPIGWVQRLQPYAGEHWWLFGLVVVVSGLLAVAAVALSAHRDVGAGLLPPRPGPATAAPTLGSPLGLAWRLHRALLAAWVAGFAVLGVVFGGLAQGLGDLVRDNRQLADMFARLGGAGALIDSYLAGSISLLGMIASGYAIQATLRLRAEEVRGGAEAVLATAVSRRRWAASHLFFSLLGPAAALAAAGLAMGLAHGVNSGSVATQVPRLLAAALTPLPAVWVLAALAVLLTGLVPRLAPLSWGALAVSVLISLVGALLRLAQWALDISPFAHVPRVPGTGFTATGLVTMSVVAAALLAAGLVGLRRRDVPVG